MDDFDPWSVLFQFFAIFCSFVDSPLRSSLNPHLHRAALERIHHLDSVSRYILKGALTRSPPPLNMHTLNPLVEPVSGTIPLFLRSKTSSRPRELVTARSQSHIITHGLSRICAPQELILKEADKYVEIWSKAAPGASAP